VDGLDRFLGTTDNGLARKVKGSLPGVVRTGRLVYVLVTRDLNRFTNLGLGSAAGIATGYGLDDRRVEFESR
jgi:hypothetical protein